VLLLMMETVKVREHTICGLLALALEGAQQTKRYVVARR